MPMRLVDTLKWLWDPRSEEQKRYETDPLCCYTQQFLIHIKGIEQPVDCSIALKDVEVGGWLWRVDLEDEVRSWLNKRAVKGVRIDDVWYPPAMIERIEIGKHTVEML